MFDPPAPARDSRGAMRIRALASFVMLLFFAGATQVTWPLPDDSTFDREYTALGTLHGLRIPKGYPLEMRGKSLVGDAPTYELHVPRDYQPGKKPFGLLVWISPGERGGVPRPDWARVLDKDGLIWVGPNDVGNKQDTLWRTYMALEAVRSARLNYDVDDTRIYVAGMSGGGRIASHAALVGADTFTGGFYVCGCDYYRDVPVIPGDREGKWYRGFWRKPDPDLLRKGRKNRFVLLTGSDDFNLANTKAVLDGYRKDNYANITYLEVPGMGHTVPNGEWFEKGVAFLEKPQPTTRPTPATRPTTRPKPTGRIIVGPR
jgi:hypothetical protein